METPLHPAVAFPEMENTVFENAAVVLALVSEDVEVININRTALDAIGKEKSDILNRLGGEVFNCVNAWSDGRVVCGKTKKCRSCVLRNSVMSTFRNGNTHYKREGFLDIEANGKSIRLRFLLTTAAVELEGKKHVLLTLEDITELKEKEQELEETVATRDTLFSIVSHDLRGPMGSMLALSEIIQSDDGRHQQEYLQMMHQEIEHTYKLLENLLTWSRAQKGQITKNPEPLDVRTLVADTTALLTGTAAKKSIRIINEIPDYLPIQADKNMFTTVVRNTVSNAIKFTPERGQIIIRAQPMGDFVQVSVTDTGVGIPDSIKDKLFDIKINTSARGTHGEKGTGFGLVLCKDFVEKHGGRIWVESREHLGTTVYFTLPA